MKKRMIWLPLPLALALAACSPKFYVIDRHTIMEEEAAGEWPEFDKELIAKSREMGPASLRKTEINARRKRLYNVLNGELASAPDPK